MFAYALKALSYSGGMLGGGVIGVLNLFIITMMLYSVVTG
jgi:hypothetical protein